MIRFLQPNSTRLRVLAFAFLGAAAGAAWADVEAVLPSRVQVAWAPPETLSEVRDNPMKYGNLPSAEWMKLLGDYLRTRADRILPPGQQLHVTITDIALAGAFEPWHDPAADDVRYMKDVYPPRLKLHYRLMASDGSTLQEKDVKLVDLGYLQHTGLPTDTDPLRYDKRQISDWLNHEFGQR
ncbi:MAG TPA: DUF3016 domain-containing protein [Rudaea sp.]|nr:DUF3016 domain-containing protein [Rudaea sp.]